MLEVLIRPGGPIYIKRVPVTRRRWLSIVIGWCRARTSKIRRTTLLTRDSEPCIIARVEFKNKKNSMDIEWQGQGICTLYDDDGLARASACILLLHSAYLVVARDWGLQEQE